MYILLGYGKAFNVFVNLKLHIMPVNQLNLTLESFLSSKLYVGFPCADAVKVVFKEMLCKYKTDCPL
jgi:hypothetical protein